MLFNLTLQVRETYTQKAGIVNRRTKLLGDIVRPSWIHRTGQCQAIWGNNGAKRRTARTSGGRHRRCGTQLGPPSYLNPRSQKRDLGHPPPRIAYRYCSLSRVLRRTTPQHDLSGAHSNKDRSQRKDNRGDGQTASETHPRIPIA